jgi:hypothetical protein
MPLHMRAIRPRCVRGRDGAALVDGAVTTGPHLNSGGRKRPPTGRPCGYAGRAGSYRLSGRARRPIVRPCKAGDGCFAKRASHGFFPIGRRAMLDANADAFLPTRRPHRAGSRPARGPWAAVFVRRSKGPAAVMAGAGGLPIGKTRPIAGSAPMRRRRCLRPTPMRHGATDRKSASVVVKRT